MVFCNVTFSNRACAQSNSAAIKYRARARARVRPTASKSTPRPGTTFIPDSRSAKALSPRARAAVTACALVIPAGSRRPITPLNSRSVAWPRIRGTTMPIAVPVMPSVMTAALSRRCGASRFTRRDAEPQKLRERDAVGCGAAPRGRSLMAVTARPGLRRSSIAMRRTLRRRGSRPIAIRGSPCRRSSHCRQRSPGRLAK